MNIKKFLNSIKYTLLKDKRIALIKLDGIILETSQFPIASSIIDAFYDAKKQGIKAVVFRINSPGGTVGASQEIYEAIKTIQKDGIKVIASFGDVAASGGVYAGVAADKIVSAPGTVTGSIGVIIKSSVMKDLYKKIGVKPEVVKSGKYKDILSNAKYLSGEERQILQEMIDNTYEQFVKVIATERNMEIKDVKKFADGRIFTGLQAKELGLIDEIGSLKTAINLAVEMLEIKGEPQIIDITPKKSFMQKITGISTNKLFKSIGISELPMGIPLWLMEEL
ncbi:MAG: signal peptide peptidase SppA [Candidatus Gastranaerophilales bacterium]|nr:signal peptide peptidase SppA [Candidatus Gastranaerophilales bacterium]